MKPPRTALLLAPVLLFVVGCLANGEETESYACPTSGATLCATCQLDGGAFDRVYCNEGLSCPADPCNVDTTCLDEQGQEDWGDGIMYSCGVEQGSSGPGTGAGAGSGGGCYPPTGCGYGWLSDCDNLCYETAEDCAAAGPAQGCYSGTCRQCP